MKNIFSEKPPKYLQNIPECEPAYKRDNILQKRPIIQSIFNEKHIQ